MRHIAPAHEADLRREADRAERGDVLAEAEPVIAANILDCGGPGNC